MERRDLALDIHHQTLVMYYCTMSIYSPQSEVPTIRCYVGVDKAVEPRARFQT